MAVYSNLILDSVLVGDTINLLKFHGGRVAASVVADEVFGVRSADEDFARQLVADMTAEDPRLRFNPDQTVELVLPNFDNQKLSETEFVVFDTETTGSKPPFARMTEIGCYKVKNGEIVGEFESLVNPHTVIPMNIVALTGITNEMAQDAPNFFEIMPELLRFIGDSVLVAHNAGFDMRFLDYEIGRVVPHRKLINPNLCTVRLSRKLLPNIKNHRLHTIAEYYGITIRNRHRAAGDALATAQIFVEFLKQLDKKGVRSIAALKHARG